MKKCQVCGGNKTQNGTECPKCKGIGILRDDGTAFSKNNEPSQDSEVCPKCKGLKWIYYTEEVDGIEYEFGEKCECYSIKQTESRIIRSGINSNDLKKGFKDFETFHEGELTGAKRTSVEYCLNFKKTEYDRNNSLALMGASGRGKTALALIVTTNLIKDFSVDVYYMPYKQVMSEIKRTMVEDKRAYAELMDKIKKTRVLFIDDLFKGQVTSADIDIVYEIINHRYLAWSPIIITTQLLKEDLEKIDTATAGRIVEMCKGKTVAISDRVPNYRTRDL